jgi:hypothetical protein
VLSDNQHSTLRTASFHRQKGDTQGFIDRVVALHERANPAQREALLAWLVERNAAHLFDFADGELVGADLSYVRVAA